MTHPSLPDGQVAESTASAFEAVWKPRGWELAPQVPDPKLALPSDPKPSAAPEPPVSTPTPVRKSAKKEQS
jgi:hypothetical protein